MSEARYSFTTKVNSDLFTIRGDTAEEFTTNLATVLEPDNKIGQLISQLQAATTVRK